MAEPTPRPSETGRSFLPLSRPSITPDDIAAVTAVLKSGWLTIGRWNSELELAFAKRTGSDHAVTMNSATAGMHLVLHALGIGPGDEVITPSMTWVSTINLITLVGATPVFVDIDRDTLMTHAEHVEAALTERTRLIVPVHFAGAPLDLAPLRALAARHGLPLVEDAAHATGTEYAGQAIGGTGTAIFSFHPIKNITTGEGGLVCTDSEALADKLRMYRFHGLRADAYDRESHGRAPQAEVFEPGFKYNLPDMNAALGVSQLARLDEFNRRRTALAAHYRERLASISEIQPLAIPAYPHKHAWHLFVIRLDVDRAGMSRDDFMERLKQRGIGTGLHFRAAHTHHYYREHANLRHPLPNTEWNSERICSLPLFPDMTSHDVDRVCEAIRTVLAEGHQ